MKIGQSKDRLVYSTEQGKMCPECTKPIKKCICQQKTPLPSIDGMVRVSRETKGRKGKGVTVVKGLALEGAALIKLGKTLKVKCGSGGTVKEGMIEIQGDHIEVVMETLKKQGWKVKRSGG
jgi:translation initiation factor 1